MHRIAADTPICTGCREEMRAVRGARVVNVRRARMRPQWWKADPRAPTAEGAGMVGVRRATWSVGCVVLAVVALLVGGAPLDTARVAGAATTVLDRPVVASSDDAEETSTGSVSLTSTDLELVNDGTDQTVGMRFTALAVPPGAPIVAAWVQFEVDEATTDATTLQVRAQAADDAAPFVKATANLSARPRTAASVPWVPAPWPTTQVAGVDQRTPSLVAPIQEVVNRPGWKSGNAIAVLVTG